MKQQKFSPKRLEELKNLYQNHTVSRFKIKTKKQSKTYNNFEKTKIFSTKELVFSLLLTFVIITIQLLVAKFI